MAAFSTISSKGQITVPVEVRQRLGLKAGDRVEFAVENGQTVLRPETTEENPFLKDVGALGGFSTREEVNARLSEMRDYEGRIEDLREIRESLQHEVSGGR